MEYTVMHDLEPTEPPPPQFDNPVYVIRELISAWQEQGSLPGDGGMLDQDLWLMKDFREWMRHQNYHTFGAQKHHKGWLDEERERNGE